MKREVTIGIVCLAIGAGIGHVITRRSVIHPLKLTKVTEVPKDSPTRKFAKELTVPMVPFDDGVSIEDAVEYLRGRARTGIEIDGLPMPYRLNFVIVDPNHTAKPITLDLRDIRLDYLCERMAQVSGLSVSFDQDAIVFSAKNTRGEQVVAPHDR